jgi:acetyl-CoA carboxylase biotin carboxyl carrier protein
MTEIRAPITGNVWQIHVAVGDDIAEGDLVVVIESMKLEIPVEAEMAGTVREVVVAVGDPVAEDDVMLVLE